MKSRKAGILNRKMKMPSTLQDPSAVKINHLHEWFQQELPERVKINYMKVLLRGSSLHTVCESAHCPNMGKCWREKVASFMILGDICTRACRFCAVKAGHPEPVDKNEPKKIADAVKCLNLRYVVITSVARDDLLDGGAGHFRNTIEAIREVNPETAIEVLVPDFSNKVTDLDIVVRAKPQVVSHNIETVRRLSRDIRPQADYSRSLDVLRNFKRLDPSIITKSGFMVGLGEAKEEIEETMKDLKETGCEILTIGQYLAPTTLKRHVRVQRFFAPKEFQGFKELGLSLGFKHVESAPLVRSSFIAEEGYTACMLELGSH